MQHTDLPDSGHTGHYDIDLRLPTPQEKDALAGQDALPADLLLDPGYALYFLKSGNAIAEENGNWRVTMDGDDLVIQVRVSGSWQTEARFTP